METFFAQIAALGVSKIFSILAVCLFLVFGYLYWRKTGRIYTRVTQNLSRDELDSLIAYHEDSAARLKKIRDEVK